MVGVWSLCVDHSRAVAIGGHNVSLIDNVWLYMHACCVSAITAVHSLLFTCRSTMPSNAALPPPPASISSIPLMTSSVSLGCSPIGSHISRRTTHLSGRPVSCRGTYCNSVPIVVHPLVDTSPAWLGGRFSSGEEL